MLSRSPEQISKLTLLKSWSGSSLRKDLKKNETILGADGVGVLWPAVFQNATDGKAGEDIDQEMFENAHCVQGIDQLIGVGVQENREGWQFWTRDVSSR